jgi:hypothetical protein
MQHTDHRHCRVLRAHHERPRRRTAKRDDEFSSPDMDWHATLRRGHATEGTISHMDVLCCGISNRPYGLGIKDGEGDPGRAVANARIAPKAAALSRPTQLPSASRMIDVA